MREIAVNSPNHFSDVVHALNLIQQEVNNSLVDVDRKVFEGSVVFHLQSGYSWSLQQVRIQDFAKSGGPASEAESGQCFMVQVINCVTGNTLFQSSVSVNVFKVEIEILKQTENQHCVCFHVARNERCN